MLVVNRIGLGAGRYYLHDAPAGEWVGGGAAALGLEGPVEAADLDAVLAGRDPRHDTPLPARAGAHRRPGWDLIAAAPKSVSLVAGLSPPPRAERIGAAHRQAARDVVAWIEEHACWARRRGGLVGTSGLVAVRFDHLRSAAGDPHLHSHVLVANLVQAGDGRWSALDASSLWTHRRAVAAAYHLSLRHHLAGQGITGPWRLSSDGTFDLAEIPHPALRATSSRSTQVAAAMAGADGPTAAAHRSARARSRSTGEHQWWEAATAAGFGPGDAATVGRRGPSSPTGLAGREREAAVTGWLAGHRSSFTTVDVMAALAATVPAGCDPRVAQEWAERFCARSPPAPGGRRTTAHAAAADDALAERAGRGTGRGLAAGALSIAGDVLAVRGLSPSGRFAERLGELLTGGNAVDVVRAPARPGGPARHEPFVEQAALIDAVRAAWERAGHRVAILTPPGQADRWDALAALRRAQPHRPPTVVVVDRADRLSTPQLHAVLDQAERIPAKVVLVRGGTLPPRRRALSEGFERLDAAVGRDTPAPAVHPGASPASVAAGGLVVSPGTLQAIDRVVEQWLGMGGVMVGLGPAEVVALNAGARRLLRAEGGIQGPDAVVAGRPFAVGDRVIPLSRSVAPPGSEGTVVAVDVASHRVGVAWPGHRDELDHWSARNLGHAYAVTPGGLSLRPGAVLVLGDPAALGPHRDRVELASLVAPAVGAGADRAEPAGLFRREAEARLLEVRGGLALALGRTAGPEGLTGRKRDAPGLGL